MAVAIVGGGSASAGTTSVTPSHTATVNPGDGTFLVVVNKYPTNGPSTPSGFNTITNGQASGGAGAAGVDSGDVYVTLFFREADGSEDGTTVTVSIPSGNSAISRIMRATKTSGAAWDIAAVQSSDNSAGVNFAVSFPATLDVKQGDHLLVVCGINGNVADWSGQAITGSGLTTGTGTERSDVGTTAGDDLSYMIWDVDVTAGAGATFLVFSMTGSISLGNTPAGACVCIRLREVFIGDGAATMSGFGAAGTGEQQFIGDGAATMSSFGGAAAAELVFEADGAATMSSFGAVSAAELQFIADGAALLSGFAAAAVAELAFEANGTGLLSGFDAATGTGELQFIADVFGLMSSFEAAADVTVTNPPNSFVDYEDFAGIYSTNEDFDGGRSTIEDFEGTRG